MTINLYKEDGYSLWALLKRFPELLSVLGDPTPSDDPGIVVFYRPSFGRADSQTDRRKQFGEFDILIGTPHGVYPIESKPEKCAELNRVTGVVALREEQIRRHRIFATYRAMWQRYRPQSWTELHSAANEEFQRTHEGWTMAERRNDLGRNLEFVLRSLENCGETVRDTILLFHKAGRNVVFTNDQGFACCTMPLEMVEASNFVSIEGVVSRAAPTLGSALEIKTSRG